MVHRKTVLAIVALLALVLLAASHNDSAASTSLGRHISSVKNSNFASTRLGGSAFSTCGDPDEIATAGSSHKNNGIGDADLIGSRPAFRGGDNGGSFVMQNKFLRYLLLCLKAGVLGLR